MSSPGDLDSIDGMSNPPWKNPGISLGMRCVLLAKAEMANGVAANPAPGPNTGERVREYLAGCIRDLNGDGLVGPTEFLKLKEGNWCAAFASWCLEQCILDGEIRPHYYRAGVVEIVSDAKAKGLWHSFEDVLADRWAPWTGDLAIWDRSDAGKPETAWWRHVNRVAAWGGIRDGVPRMITIGGNESRAIRVVDQPPKNLRIGKLLGFVSYRQANEVEHTPQQRAADLALVQSFHAVLSTGGVR